VPSPPFCCVLDTAASDGSIAPATPALTTSTHQDIVISGDRPVDLLELEHVRRAVAGLEDGPHGVPSLSESAQPNV
jgi:hypothetical protein